MCYCKRCTNPPNECTCRNIYERPPLGLTPRFIRDEQRVDDIVAAIERFITARKEIPNEWLEEYNELVKRK